LANNLKLTKNLYCKSNGSQNVVCVYHKSYDLFFTDLLKTEAECLPIVRIKRSYECRNDFQSTESCYDKCIEKVDPDNFPRDNPAKECNAGNVHLPSRPVRDFFKFYQYFTNSFYKANSKSTKNTVSIFCDFRI